MHKDLDILIYSFPGIVDHMMKKIIYTLLTPQPLCHRDRWYFALYTEP